MTFRRLAANRPLIDEALAKSQRGIQGSATVALIAAALANRTMSAADAQGPVAPTAPNFLFVVGMKAVAQVSGRFECAFNLNYTGATAADTIQWEVRSQTQAGANSIQFTGGAAIQTADSQGQIVVASAAAGITVVGGPFNQILQYNSGVQVQPTGGTTGLISWTGVIDFPASNPSFAVGNSVAVLLQLGFGADTGTFVSTSAYLKEMAF
jgi:hypothetical protein